MLSTETAPTAEEKSTSPTKIPTKILIIIEKITPTTVKSTPCMSL
ncbi:hypothetical protein [Clostridium gasigenes]|nr:hypothetical protein [Clostridium gasigenes]